MNKAAFALLHEEFLALLCDLISFRSTNSRKDELANCAGYIKKWLETNGITYDYHEQNGIPSILLGCQGSIAEENINCPPLLCMAHFDVVEGMDEQFKPRLDGDKLYGRGSIDDKYAVAFGLILYREHLRRAKEQGGLPGYALLFTGDEEVGGENGAGFMSGLLNPQFCLALDGGSPCELVTREKGVLRLKLLATGKSAHGARPWLGDNAMLVLAKDLLLVESLFQDMAKAYTASLPAHWHPTCTIGVVRSGDAVNKVPDKAEAWLDIRFTENDDPESLLALLKKELKSSVIIDDLTAPLVHRSSALLESLLASIPGGAFTVAHGASDAQYFSQKNISCAIWGPDGENSQHGPDEHINLSGAYALMEILYDYLGALPMFEVNSYKEGESGAGK